MSNAGRKILMLAVPALLVAGCQQADKQDNQVSGNTVIVNGADEAGVVPDSTIAQSLARSGELSTFASAIKASGLEGTMAGAQPYTIFAPNDAAFRKLPDGLSGTLMQPESKGKLTGIMTYHIVPGVVTAKDLHAAIEKGGGKAELATVGGVNLTATHSGDMLMITDAKGGQAHVAKADMLQSNGVVHVLDTVLMPS